MSTGARIVIVGRRPPPLGGVTVHIDRLCGWLTIKQVEYDHVDIRNAGVGVVVGKILKGDLCHIHLSNPIAICIVLVFSRAAGKKCIFTLHGDISQSTGMRQLFTRFSIWLAHTPILLNRKSFVDALRLNERARLVSAFIPPVSTEKLDEQTARLIIDKAIGKSRVVITAAYDYVIDESGDEVYGIFEVIEFCRKIDVLLIVSDPSGNYAKAAQARNSGKDAGASSVIFISRPHSFVAALAYADVYVRNTNTDGDSLSIHEALFKNKEVWASDVVERPKGVNLYRTLEEIRLGTRPTEHYVPPRAVDDVIEIYRQLTHISDTNVR